MNNQIIFVKPKEFKLKIDSQKLSERKRKSGKFY